MQLLLGEAFHAALSVSAEQNADVKPRDLQAALPGLQVSFVQHSAAHVFAHASLHVHCARLLLLLQIGTKSGSCQHSDASAHADHTCLL